MLHPGYFLAIPVFPWQSSIVGLNNYEISHRETMFHNVKYAHWAYNYIYSSPLGIIVKLIFP